NRHAANQGKEGDEEDEGSAAHEMIIREPGETGRRNVAKEMLAVIVDYIDR
ncbi:hypothetical protein LARV_03703, partial [Longilinea arvoryzae]